MPARYLAAAAAIAAVVVATATAAIIGEAAAATAAEKDQDDDDDPRATSVTTTTHGRAPPFITLLSYGEPQKVLQKLSQPRIIYEYCLERHLRHAKSDCRASAACAAFLHSAEKIFAALYQLE